MIDLLRDVFGKELSAGLLAYVIAVLVVSQPISQRIAERDHLPACRAGELSAARKQSMIPSADQEAMEDAKAILKQAPGIGDLFAKTIEAMAAAKQQRREDIARNNAVAGAATCRCRMTIALDQFQNRMLWGVYVGSLKLIDPITQNFGAAIATVDGSKMCTGEKP